MANIQQFKSTRAFLKEINHPQANRGHLFLRSLINFFMEREPEHGFLFIVLQDKNTPERSEFISACLGMLEGGANAISFLTLGFAEFFMEKFYSIETDTLKYTYVGNKKSALGILTAITPCILTKKEPIGIFLESDGIKKFYNMSLLVFDEVTPFVKQFSNEYNETLLGKI